MADMNVGPLGCSAVYPGESQLESLGGVFRKRFWELLLLVDLFYSFARFFGGEGLYDFSKQREERSGAGGCFRFD